MTRILFLLAPVLFGGLCLLFGETIHWAKTRRRGGASDRATVLINIGRE